MSEDTSLLTETEARKIATNFLLGRHPESSITFSSSQLTSEKDVPVYQLQGILTMRSRGTLDRFVFPSPASQYNFKIEIHAAQRNIVNYEFR